MTMPGSANAADITTLAAVTLRPGRRAASHERGRTIATVPAAATTEIQGSDGFHEEYDARVRQHRVTVRGKHGSTVTYTLKSQAGKQEVTDTLTVKF